MEHNQEEKAWAAGFFDGEGHSRAVEMRKRVVVSQSVRNQETLDRFEMAVGVTGRRVPVNRGRGINLTFYGTQSEAVMDVILPYLCSAKRNQWLKAKELAEAYQIMRKEA